MSYSKNRINHARQGFSNFPYFSARYRGGAVGWLVIFLAVIGLVTGLWFAYGAMTSNQSSSLTAQSIETHQVSRGSFDITVIANGEIQAKQKVVIKSQVDGMNAILEIVAEGTIVKKGDTILRLADDAIRNKIEQETLSVEQARADKLAAQQEYAIQLNEADSNLKAAELKLELSKLDLEKWTRGDDPKKIRELDVAVQKATRNLQRAKEELEASEQLFKEDFISQSELEDDRLDVIEAESALKTALLNVEVYKKYIRPKEQKKVQSDVSQALAGLERTKHRNESKLAQSHAKMQGKIRTLAIREDRMEKLQEQLENCHVRAPQNGMVIYASTIGGWRRRGDPIAQGKQVRKNESLVVLPDTSQMVASVKVHESLVGQVSLGQNSVITIDADSSAPIEGPVVEIGVMASDGGWMNPDLREYAIKIDLPPNLGDRIKPAMRCSAKIMAGRLENVLFVPIQCIASMGRKNYIYLREGEKVTRQQVTLGRSNESVVAILKGIKEGDRVMMAPPVQVDQAGQKSDDDAMQKVAGDTHQKATSKREANPASKLTKPKNKKPRSKIPTSQPKMN